MDRRNFLHLIGMAVAGSHVNPGDARAVSGLKDRLGITTDEITADFEAALKFVREFGLGWVEIRNLWNGYVTEASIEDCKKAKALLDRYGVKLSVLDTALYKCNLPGTKTGRRDDYPYKEQEELLKRALERSEILGTRFVRVFSFWRVDKPETVFDQVAEHLMKACELARAADRILLMENVGGATAETGAEAARLLNAVRSPNLGLLWDPNNAYCAGEKPIPDGYSRLDRKRIYHVHLRDAARDPRTNQCDWLPVGKGDVDNLSLLRALVSDGFHGTLNLETHYQRPDKIKELATRESLKGLLEIMDRV